ncbi:MAG: type II secretion system protein [Candidatus Sumerlaeia bacterium]|nr:type II secretion system protein [Candidatus Sumerlaeia bacterium]
MYYNPRALTMVELLISISIVSLLATVGIFNLQEAQTRSKVSKVESDMRVMQHALEQYRADQGAYPPAALGDLMLMNPLSPLLSPVPYLGAIPTEPFGPASLDLAPSVYRNGYLYLDEATTSRGLPGETYGNLWDARKGSHYMLQSPGPNRVWDVLPFVPYDPTNGTVSRGDIARFGA